MGVQTNQNRENNAGNKEKVQRNQRNMNINNNNNRERRDSGRNDRNERNHEMHENRGYRVSVNNMCISDSCAYHLIYFEFNLATKSAHAGTTTWWIQQQS